MTDRPVEILLVEDNLGDIRLTKKAFERSALDNRVTVVTDGEAALRYLRREPPYEDATTPDLVLLDINLPKISGSDVLREIKQDKDLRMMPVVMLTSSDREADIRASYNDHVNSYITKPSNFPKLMEAVRSLEDYWFVVVKRVGDSDSES